MPSRTSIATLECAGNGRVFLSPPLPGAQWQLGAVGNAEWTGVPLAVVPDFGSYVIDHPLPIEIFVGAS